MVPAGWGGGERPAPRVANGNTIPVIGGPVKGRGQRACPDARGEDSMSQDGGDRGPRLAGRR